MAVRDRTRVAFVFAIIAAVSAYGLRRLAQVHARISAIDSFLSACGRVDLGIERAEVDALLGPAVSQRRVRPTAAFGRPAVVLTYPWPEASSAPWIKLDEATGRVVEVFCGGAYHLEPTAELLRDLGARRQPAPGSGARP